jgi:hypothetical protein
MSYCLYYDLKEETGKCRAVHPETKELITINSNAKVHHSFMMLSTSGLDGTDEDLIKYIAIFDEWCDQLKNNSVYKFDYKSCYNDNGAVSKFFTQLSKGTGHNTHEKVDIMENEWMAKTYNSGVIYGSENIGRSYGYDYIMTYPNAMVSHLLKIPTKRGKEQTLKSIPDKLEYGYYHVNITSDNPEFRKVFAYSKDNVYTHYSVDFARKHAKQFNVNIELVRNLDEKPNAYLYKDKYLVASKSIFGKWLQTLKALKTMFPKNGLIKHLASTLYGHLKVKNLIIKTPDEIHDEELDIGLGKPHKYTVTDNVHYDDGNEKFFLVETDDVYKSPLARIQPMITSFVRNKVGYFALRNGLEKVIRVYIDNVCFTEPIDISKIPDIKLETKTTGFIHFKNASMYVNFDEPNMKTINKYPDLQRIYKEGKKKYKFTN